MVRAEVRSCRCFDRQRPKDGQRSVKPALESSATTRGFLFSEVSWFQCLLFGALHPLSRLQRVFPQDRVVLPLSAASLWPFSRTTHSASRLRELLGAGSAGTGMLCAPCERHRPGARIPALASIGAAEHVPQLLPAASTLVWGDLASSCCLQANNSLIIPVHFDSTGILHARVTVILSKGHRALERMPNAY